MYRSSNFILILFNINSFIYLKKYEQVFLLPFSLEGNKWEKVQFSFESFYHKLLKTNLSRKIS